MATSVSANRKRASQHLAIGVYILNKQNITCPLVDTNFIFSFSTRYLTCSLRSLVRYRVEHSKIKFVSTCGHVISSILEMNEWPRLHFYTIATLETRRKLGRVNFCKDFWDCYYIGTGEKSANSADRASSVIIPETVAGRKSAPVPFSFLKRRMISTVSRFQKFPDSWTKQWILVKTFSPTYAEVFSKNISSEKITAWNLPFRSSSMTIWKLYGMCCGMLLLFTLRFEIKFVLVNLWALTKLPLIYWAI